MNFNLNLIESYKQKLASSLLENRQEFVAQNRQAYYDRMRERNEQRRAKEAARREETKKREAEQRAERKAQGRADVEIIGPKKPTIVTVPDDYSGPSINPDGSFNLSAAQQAQAKANREASQAAKEEDARGPGESRATQYGRLAQRIGSAALRPPRSQYEADRLAGARQDVERAHAEAVAQGRKLGYEDEATLRAGFERRGYQFGAPLTDQRITAQERYNEAKANRDRVVADVERSRRERQQTPLFSDQNTNTASQPPKPTTTSPSPQQQPPKPTTATSSRGGPPLDKYEIEFTPSMSKFRRR